MIYCTRCGTPQESGSPFCTGCGNQANPAPSTPFPPSPALGPTTHPRRRDRFVIVLVALVLLLGGGAAAWAVLAHRVDPPAPPDALPPQPQAAASPTTLNDQPQNVPGTVLASAVCVSSSSQDRGGNPVTYEPAKAVDGLLDTAWRCDGDGTGQQLRVSFPGRVILTSIGMVPGYAKIDPYDSTDRYVQNRRISAVGYTFDDGSTVRQSFDTSASARALQTIALPDVSTSQVTITIFGSVSGEATNGQQPFDKVAISEVSVSVR
ncbi:MAG: NADase-type glycan-binding domain-containing protein [Pseudonocardiaceae bacterium]